MLVPGSSLALVTVESGGSVFAWSNARLLAGCRNNAEAGASYVRGVSVISNMNRRVADGESELTQDEGEGLPPLLSSWPIHPLRDTGSYGTSLKARQT